MAKKEVLDPSSGIMIRKRSAWEVFKKNWTLLALSLPMIIYLFIFNYIPMFGIVLAFKNFNYRQGILGSPWVGFDNFKFFFQSSDMVRVVRNALCYNAVGIFLGVVVSVALALLLFELSNRILLRTYQTLMFIPHLLSWVVVAYMVYAFLNPRAGILNRWLHDYFGYTESINWYNDAFKWIFIIPFAYVWKSVGMNALIYYASLMGIDEEYFEAASIEGATRLQIVKNITLPFLYPTVTILTILAIGKIFNSDFGLFYQLPMGSTSILATTDVIETYTFRALMDLGNIGLSSAVGLVQSVVGLILVLLTNWITRKIDPERALY